MFHRKTISIYDSRMVDSNEFAISFDSLNTYKDGHYFPMLGLDLCDFNSFIQTYRLTNYTINSLFFMKIIHAIRNKYENFK